jgi:hypothetical protein
MVHGPIWCKCKKQSWTRSHLKWAWEQETTVRCSNTECGREIEPHVLEELLQRIGVLHLEQGGCDAETEEISPDS